MALHELTIYQRQHPELAGALQARGHVQAKAQALCGVCVVSRLAGLDSGAPSRVDAGLPEVVAMGQ